MSDPFTNLEQKTGRTMPAWISVVEASGLTKHAEIVSWLKQEHALTHGFANGIALAFRNRDADDDDLVTPQYAGPKAALLPVYERIVAAASQLGDDVEIIPKKSGVSLRRSKQFALIEVPSAKRVQLGLQLKGVATTDRLLAGNAMCSHRVSLSTIDEVDDEVLRWLREAYERG